MLSQMITNMRKIRDRINENTPAWIFYIGNKSGYIKKNKKKNINKLK